MLSYQWYCGVDAIADATTASFTIPTTSAGTFTYSCKVTNTYEAATTEEGKTANKTSGKITVTVTVPVTNAGAVTITVNPESAEYVQDDTAAALSVTETVAVSATELRGTVTYQWYMSTTGESAGFEPIEGAAASSYTPSTSVVGTAYYYCLVTNTASNATGETVMSASSETATITVTAPQEVTGGISIDFN